MGAQWHMTHVDCGCCNALPAALQCTMDAAYNSDGNRIPSMADGLAVAACRTMVRAARRRMQR